jgi:hypothetical protein
MARPGAVVLLRLRSVLFAVLLLAPIPVAAQEAAPGPEAGVDGAGQDTGALRVFLDCNTYCDRTFFREEIAFVNWVRDRADSEVHVIVTDQDTGGGGEEFIFQFLGQGRLAGQESELRFLAGSTDTRDEIRSGQARVLAIGLANYSAMLGRVEGITVEVAESFRAGDEAVGVPTGLEDDPWRLWVFNLNADGAASGEEKEDSYRFSGGFSANRTTEVWRARFRASGSYSQQQFELSDSSISTTVRRSWSISGATGYALARFWSIGVQGRINSESRQNLDLGGNLFGAIEYSFLPYEEASRRQAFLYYQLGIAHFEYEEETIYDQTTETRPVHELVFELDYQQPWGSAAVTAQTSQYLHDLSLYELRLSPRVDFRIFRGLSLNVRGSLAKIENQIYLPKGDLTDEEILTQRRERGTGFRYEFRVGLRYAFGSIYNNIVNNRFDRLF